MNITRRIPVQLALLTLGLALVVAPAFTQSTHVLVPAEKVQWGPAPPFLPAGAQISVLEGNPSEKGAVTLRLKFPANYNIPAHWHSMTERITVLSGNEPSTNGVLRSDVQHQEVSFQRKPVEMLDKRPRLSPLSQSKLLRHLISRNSAYVDVRFICLKKRTDAFR